jgi:hypothetical protein
MKNYLTNILYNELSVMFTLYLFSRFFFLFILKIYPDQNVLSTSWVIVHPYFLKNHFLESILYLNFQPPLFNFFIGLLFQVFDSETIVTNALHIINIIITILILFLFRKICKSYFLKKKQIIYLSLLIIFNPAIFFYETYVGNYVHYAVLTLILIFYLSKRYFESNNESYEIYIYFLLLSLIYIWAAFSPIILIIFFLITVIFKFKNKLKIKKSFFIFFACIIISVLPSIKNFYFFKYLSNGSYGLGWHLAMTTSSIKNDFTLHHACNPFANTNEQNYEYYKKYNISENELSITNKPNKNFYNAGQLGRIFKMEKCRVDSVKYIQDNFRLWVKSRINEFFISHGQLAIDISFIVSHPKNFEKYKDFLLDIHKNKITKFLKQILLISYFFIIYIYFFYFIFFRNRRTKDNYSYYLIFLIYFYIVGTGTIFSNYEGSRFIYSGFIVQLIFWINIIKDYNYRLKIINERH